MALHITFLDVTFIINIILNVVTMYCVYICYLAILLAP